MLTKILALLCRSCPPVRSGLWKQWYQFLARVYGRRDWNFMNYGYAPVDGGTESLRLDSRDEDNRIAIQLYHHVASAVDLRNLDVLEVGSGRGGGADYVMRYLKPRRMVGVDFSERAVAFSRRHHVADRLSFAVGNAEALPFPEHTFDAIINVESSHCYRSMEVFLSEVRRVLRKNGLFLFADFRGRERVGLLRDQLRGSGMTLLRETDITGNVVKALDLDSERKTAIIKRTVHGLLVPWFLEFAGGKGSGTYGQFRSGRCVYLSFVLRKGDDTARFSPGAVGQR